MVATENKTFDIEDTPQEICKPDNVYLVDLCLFSVVEIHVKKRTALIYYSPEISDIRRS